MTDTKSKGGRPRSTDPRTMRGMRMTAGEWAVYQALGGSAWLSKQLARARLTPEQRAQVAQALEPQQPLDLPQPAAPQ